MVRIVQALATIQTRTGTEVTIPDVSTLSSKELGAIRRAASLIAGHTVVGTWTEITFDKFPDADLDPAGHYQIAVIQPLTVTLNGEVMTLGSVEQKALSAAVASISDDEIRVVPHLNDTIHSDFLPIDSSTLGPHQEGKQLVRGRQLPDADSQDTSREIEA